MIKRNQLIVLSALAILAVPTMAQAQAWEIDAAHSRIGFSVRYMMVSNVQGAFTGVKGTAELDPAKPAAAKISAEVDVKTIDTGIEKRDAHLRAADFFDADKFPTTSFVSKKIEAAAPGKFRMTGDLTLRGVTRSVTFEAEGFDRPVKDMQGATRLGGSAVTTINRKDFGLTWSKTVEAGGVVVGDEVKIILDVNLVRKP